VRKAIFILTGLVLLAVLNSCRVSRPISTNVQISGTATDYINTYKDLAISEMRRTGVPASITLAQGMLESDYGRSSLARLGNNHFGIKCHNDWTGQTIRQNDDRRNECFRKYRRPEDSFYDHSDFLRTGSRYRFLFDYEPTNYKAWAYGLKKAGYATHPDYASMLIRKIEENRLYEFDRVYTASAYKPQNKVQRTESGSTQTVKPDPAGQKTGSVPAQTQPQPQPQPPVKESTITFGDVMARAPRIMENNRVQYIVVKDGETKEKIEKDFQLLKWELARYNELDANFTPVPGQILYLEPKRDRAEFGTEYHIAAEGETMYMISQKYGIKLKSLLDMNGMAEGSNPVKDQKILLQPAKETN